MTTRLQRLPSGKLLRTPSGKLAASCCCSPDRPTTTCGPLLLKIPPEILIDFKDGYAGHWLFLDGLSAVDGCGPGYGFRGVTRFVLHEVRSFDGNPGAGLPGFCALSYGDVVGTPANPIKRIWCGIRVSYDANVPNRITTGNGMVTGTVDYAGETGRTLDLYTMQNISLTHTIFSPNDPHDPPCAQFPGSISYVGPAS